MILKIQTKCDDVYGWCFYDNIKWVSHVGAKLTEEGLKNQIEIVDNVFFDTLIKDIPNIKETLKKRVVKIHYRDNNDELRVLLLNTRCYLLNDNGQTIEKIR